MKISAAMLSTFGPNVRGVSPYADALADALLDQESIELTRIDYKRPFPEFILPKGTDYTPNNDFALLDYLSPATWDINKIRTFRHRAFPVLESCVLADHISFGRTNKKKRRKNCRDMA